MREIITVLHGANGCISIEKIVQHMEKGQSYRDLGVGHHSNAFREMDSNARDRDVNQKRIWRHIIGYRSPKAGTVSRKI
jgi:hypothetical protein